MRGIPNDACFSIPRTGGSPMANDAKAARRHDAPARSQDFGATCAAMFEGNQNALARWLHALFALSQEITQFTQARLQEDVAAWSTLAACRNPEEAMECQRRFAAKATEQYAEEIGKLSQMTMSMVGEEVVPSRQRPHVNA
jgi:phasin family protein